MRSGGGGRPTRFWTGPRAAGAFRRAGRGLLAATALRGAPALLGGGAPCTDPPPDPADVPGSMPPAQDPPPTAAVIANNPLLPPGPVVDPTAGRRRPGAPPVGFHGGQAGK